MDTPSEHEYDQIVQMASRIFDVPIVLISLVHRDRQFFKARVGLDVCETGRDVSFCNFALMGRNVFLVPDALQDERFSSNALVVGAPYIRFYAGAPLITASGHVLGSLCLIDNKPRETSRSEISGFFRTWQSWSSKGWSCVGSSSRMKTATPAS